MHRVPVATLEPVGVQQRHEQLEVFLAARVRGRGHEKEMPSVAAQEFAELIALRLLKLAAKVMRGHPVRLVHDH